MNNRLMRKYAEGFQLACLELGVDAVELVKRAQSLRDIANDQDVVLANPSIQSALGRLRRNPMNWTRALRIASNPGNIRRVNKAFETMEKNPQQFMAQLPTIAEQFDSGAVKSLVGSLYPNYPPFKDIAMEAQVKFRNNLLDTKELLPFVMSRLENRQQGIADGVVGRK